MHDHLRLSVDDFSTHLKVSRFIQLNKSLMLIKDHNHKNKVCLFQKVQYFIKVKFRRLLAVIGHCRASIDYKIRKHYSTRFGILLRTIDEPSWVDIFCYQYTNNECLWVQWSKYFHENSEMKDEMLHSTRRSRVEWYISSFTFDLHHEGHHHHKLASGILLTNFGRKRLFAPPRCE